MTTPTDRSAPIPRLVSPAGESPATSYLGRPGGRIGYDVAGRGPLVMLMPGMGDLRAAYRFLARALARGRPLPSVAATRPHRRRDPALPGRRPIRTSAGGPP